MTQEINGTLKNAIVQDRGAGEALVWGNIYGDTKGRFRDGEWIHTSGVKSIEDDIVSC